MEKIVQQNNTMAQAMRSGHPAFISGLTRIGTKMVDNITMRSVRGVDYQGNVGAELSEDYREYKVKKHRPPKRDMHLQGLMMGGLNFIITGSRMGVIMGILGKSVYNNTRASVWIGKIAEKHILGKGVPKFDFMGFSKSDFEMTKREAERSMEDFLRSVFL